MRVYIYESSWSTDRSAREMLTLSGRSRKQRLRSSPDHSWTPMMPKMKKTKKQRSRTLPSIGSVSSNSVTRIRKPTHEMKLCHASCDISEAKLQNGAAVLFPLNPKHALCGKFNKLEHMLGIL